MMKEKAHEVEALNHNIRRLTVINKIYLKTLVSIVIIIYTLETLSTISLAPQLNEVWLQYSIFLLANFVYIYLLDIKKISATGENYKWVKNMVHFYLAFVLSISAIIPVANNYHPLVLYSLILFSSIPFLVMKTKEILRLITFSSFLLLVNLGIEKDDMALYGFQAVYIFTVSAIVFFIARSSYFSYFQFQKLRTESVQEIQQLRNFTLLLKEANRQLEQEATLDPLTNLYNRRAYNDYLMDLQQSILDTAQSVSVIMVDVDCFKLFNDTYGHSEGDHVLSKIGRLLHDISVEYKCFAARWGGEEFVLILPNVSDEMVERICSQIKESVHELNIEHESSTIHKVVTVSIGACTKSITELNEIYECISEADAALYSVKENGRNNFEHRHQIHA